MSAEINHPLALVEMGSTLEGVYLTADQCERLTKHVADLAARAEVERLRGELKRIVDVAPCCAPGGGCFYPVMSPDGEYLGEQNVDPLGVIGEMVGIAAAALAPKEPAK